MKIANPLVKSLLPGLSEYNRVVGLYVAKLPASLTQAPASKFDVRRGHSIPWKFSIREINPGFRKLDILLDALPASFSVAGYPVDYVGLVILHSAMPL